MSSAAPTSELVRAPMSPHETVAFPPFHGRPLSCPLHPDTASLAEQARRNSVRSSLSPSEVLAAPGRREDGGWEVQLPVDESHQYFFDHPLDHVPGMLLLEGLIRLAEHATSSGNVVP